MFVDKLGNGHVRGKHQSLRNGDDAVSSVMPIMIFHPTAVHVINAVARIDRFVGGDFLIFQGDHERSCFKGRLV